MALLDLPTELLAQVVDKLSSSPSGLNQLRLVCKRLHLLIEPVFFHKVLLRTGKQAELLLLMRQSKPSRWSLIRQFTFSPIDDSLEQRSDKTLAVISRLQHLDALVVKRVPLRFFSDDDCFVRGFESLIRSCVPSDSPYRGLRSCHIKLYQSGHLFWSIFEHSTLEELTLDSLNATPVPPVPDCKVGAIGTPLRYLQLTLPEIETEALRFIFSRPRALQQVILHDRRYTGEPKIYRSGQEILALLSDHAPSLELLGLRVHLVCSKRWDLSRFPALRVFEPKPMLEIHRQFFHPDITPTYTWEMELPPNLQTLKISTAYHRSEDFAPSFADLCDSLRRHFLPHSHDDDDDDDNPSSSTFHPKPAPKQIIITSIPGDPRPLQFERDLGSKLGRDLLRRRPGPIHLQLYRKTDWLFGIREPPRREEVLIYDNHRSHDDLWENTTEREVLDRQAGLYRTYW